MATDHWLTSEPIILGSHTSGNNAQGRSFKSSWRRPTLRCEMVLMVVAVLVLALGGARTVVAQGSPTPSTVDDPNQGNPCSIQWFEAHGWLMWLAFGVFFPIGILVSRVGQHYFRQWFYTHIALQVTGLTLATVATAIAVNKFQVVPLNNTHVKLGLAVMILIWLQPLLSIVRPKRGTKSRPMWYVAHWLFGITAIILGWFNIFKGLDEYIQAWAGGERKAWYVIWGVQVAIMSFIYLLLDRLPHIKRQSADPGLMVDPVVKTGFPAVGTHDPKGYEIEVKTVYGNGNLTTESNQQY